MLNNLKSAYDTCITYFIDHEPTYGVDSLGSSFVQLGSDTYEKIRIYEDRWKHGYIVWYWKDVCLGFEEYHDLSHLYEGIKHNIYKYKFFDYNLFVEVADSTKA